MPRAARIAPGGMVFHVLNRSNGRVPIFDDDADYAAFERVMEATLAHVPMRILSYCVMPNHWHFVLWPKGDDHLAAFMHRLTVTHVRRWHEHRHSTGQGHLYQGTYKSFPIEQDGHYLTVCRYVERNPLRAGLVDRAEDWRWSSLWRRACGQDIHRASLSEGPVDRPAGWVQRVNRPETEKELDAIHASIARGRPFGSEDWQRRAAKRLSLEFTFRPRGRPRKKKNEREKTK